jgi:hypothetical protein
MPSPETRNHRSSDDELIDRSGRVEAENQAQQTEPTSLFGMG